LKILVAEDDLTSRRILEALLAKWGYEVDSAQNGREAWEALSVSVPPRLAILDWMMPESSGLEVLQRLRETAQNNQHTYVIILTIRDDKVDIAAALNAGADDYVTKPYDIEELRARVAVGRRVVDLQDALEDRVSKLEDALTQVKTLQGMIPICSYCKKIRDDQNYWHRVESYISANTDALFTHSICPECFTRQFPPKKKP